MEFFFVYAILILLSCSKSEPDYWMLIFGREGTDVAYSICEFHDGGFIATGATETARIGMKDIYVIRGDSHGRVIWERSYGDSLDDEGYDVLVTGEGDIMVAGYHTSSETGEDVYLLNLDSGGDINWSRVYKVQGNQRGYSISVTEQNDYVIAGYSDRGGVKKKDIYLLKLNNGGEIVWYKEYGGDGDDRANRIIPAVESGYIIMGFSSSYGNGGYDLFISKFDGIGGKVWERSIGGKFNDRGYSAVQAGVEGYIFTGWSESFGEGGENIYVVKTDTEGEEIWSYTYGGGNWDAGMDITYTDKGGLLLTGYTNSYGSGSEDVYLMRLDSDGNTEWVRTYGESEEDYGYSVCRSGNGFYVCGSTYSYGARFGDILIMKIDSLGHINYKF